MALPICSLAEAMLKELFLTNADQETIDNWWGWRHGWKEAISTLHRYLGDPEVAPYDSLVLRLMEQYRVRPFDWARYDYKNELLTDGRLVFYVAKDRNEFLELGGGIKNIPQPSNVFIAYAMEVSDEGEAVLEFEAGRLGLIRREEPALQALPVVRLTRPFDPSRYPIMHEDRKPGHWSS